MLGSIQEVFFIYAIDHSRLFYVSPAYEQIWGQSCDSLYQQPLSWIEALHPDDRERILTAIKKQHQGQPFRQEYRIIRPDGSIRWIYARTISLGNEAKPDDQAKLDDETKILASLERFVMLAEDVTGRKESDQQLHRLNRSLRMISECNQELVRSTDEATLLQNICQIIVDFGGYRAAWIGFAEHNAEQRVSPVAQAGYAKDYLQSLQISWADSELGQGAMGTAIRTGEVRVTQDALADPAYAPWHAAIRQAGYASLVALPLIVEKQTIGALGIYAAHPYAFDSEEVKLLMELANDLAFGIGALRTRVTQQHNEMKFQMFLKMASEAVIISNGKGEVVVFNAKAEEIFGYSAAEVLGSQIEYLMPERFRQGHEQFRADYYTYPSRRSMGHARNLYAQRKDGTEFPIEAGLSSVQIGDERFVLTFLTDISDRAQLEAERQRTEAALRQSEERLRLVLQNMPVMLDALDAAGNIIVWNQECERVTGYSAAEIVGNPDAMVWFFPDAEYRHRMLTAWAMQGDDFRNWEWELTCKDGSVKTIAWSNIAAQFPVPGWASWGIGVDVTERKQAETTLRQTEEMLRQVNQELEHRVNLRTTELSQLNDRLQQELQERIQAQHQLAEQAQLLELAHDTIMTRDPNGVITFWNQGAEQMYGWTKDEALGQLSHILLKTQFPQPLNAIETELLHHSYWEGELIHTRRDGTAIVVASRWVLQHDETGKPLKVLEINNDITISKRAEEIQSRLAAIIESSDDAIISTNLDGIVDSWNLGAEKLYGYSAAEIVGQSIALLLPNDRLHEDADIIQRLKQGEQIKPYETVRRHKDGRSFDISLSASPLKNAAGEIIGVSKIVRDITQQKQAEMQLRLSSERISLANAELARAARLKDEFLAGMSHELRTPLNAILGLSEAFLEGIFGELSHEQQEHLTIIQHSGEHLLALINDILDLSKVESGKMELEIKPVVIRELCDSSLSFIKQQAHQKRIKVTCQIDPALTEVELDERRVRQVLVNLLSNAVKFTPDGGNVQLQVRADSFRETLEFSVTDTGIGIAPENMGKLFQPFVQLDGSLSRRYAGTGLGLALVRRICELHGGSVSLESQEGKGSCFTVILPWNPVVETEEPPQISFLTPQSLNLRQALIVEDSQTAANQIVRYLAELGAEPLVYPIGSGVVQVASQLKPDVIILDILLPDRSGWEVLAELKANPVTQNIPVIVVSVVDEQPRALALGAVAYLLKPITRQQLQQVLNQVLMPTAHTRRAALILAETLSSTFPLILLAEDNETNIATFNSYLQACGYRVLLARNGLEAIQMTRQHNPDLILMDIQMPEMDGLEAMQRIRSESEWQHIPIIALTALAMPNDRERCLEAGAVEYLTKPISLKRLMSIVARYIPPGDATAPAKPISSVQDEAGQAHET